MDLWHAWDTPLLGSCSNGLAVKEKRRFYRLVHDDLSPQFAEFSKH